MFVSWQALLFMLNYVNWTLTSEFYWEWQCNTVGRDGMKSTQLWLKQKHNHDRVKTCFYANLLATNYFYIWSAACDGRQGSTALMCFSWWNDAYSQMQMQVHARYKKRTVLQTHTKRHTARRSNIYSIIKCAANREVMDNKTGANRNRKCSKPAGGALRETQIDLNGHLQIGNTYIWSTFND